MTHTPQPGKRYVVQGTLKHGRSGEESAQHPGESAGEFAHGDDFFSDDPDLLTQLHDAGAIRLPSEVEDPEVVAAREASKDAEIAALKEQLAKLKDAAPSKSGRSAKARNDAQEAAEASEGEASSEDSEEESSES